MPRETYASQSTHIEGYSLKTVKGRKVDVGKGPTRSYRSLHRRYVGEYRSKLGAEANQAQLKPQLVHVAEEIGIRGGEDVASNSVLTISSVSGKKWDLDLLKQALGDAYPTVVHDDVQVVISLIPGVDQEAVANALRGVLQTANVSAEDLDKLISVQISPRVDEEAIAEMIKRGSLTLPEGTIVDKTSWTINVDPLDKSLPKTKKRKMPKYFPAKR